MQFDVWRKLSAEALGTGLLLATVVGSGIMAERLADVAAVPSNTAVALLANAVATGAILVVLIETLGPISGAHFNPAVTLGMAIRRRITPKLALGYVSAQIAGGVLGVMAAHAMFEQDLIQASVTMRTGPSQWFAEAVATFGLMLFILLAVRFRPATVSWVVGLYITAAYWFTASTSFANPAVTIARSFTDTFSGIRPSDSPGFIGAQLVGAAIAAVFAAWLAPDGKSSVK